MAGADRTITTDLIARDKMSPALDSAGKSAETAGSKFKTFGKAAAGVAGTAGAAAAGLLAKGFADNIDISAGRAKLSGQLDLSTADTAKAGKVASEVYADNWGDSIDDINDAIKSVALNIGDVSKTSQGDLKAMTESAEILSSTFDLDVNDSTKAAGELMKTGLAKNGQQAFDIITSGMQQGDDKAGDFLDTLNEYSPVFHKLGLDGQTSVNLISQFMKAGARDSDAAADAFKEFSIRAIDGSTTTKQGFKEIGLSSKEMATDIGKGGDDATYALFSVLTSLQGMKDPVKQNIAGTKLFGTQWEDTVRNVLPKLDLTMGGIKNVDGATKKLGDTVSDTSQNKIDTMQRKFNLWIQSMSNSSSVFGQVVTAVATMGGGALSAATQIGTMAVAIKGWGAAEVVTGGETEVLAGANEALGASWLLAALPIAAIVIGIGLLTAAIIYGYKHSETFRDIVDAVWKSVAKGLLSLADTFLQGFQLMFTVLGKLPGKAGAPFRAMSGYIATARNKIKDLTTAINNVHSKTITIRVNGTYDSATTKKLITSGAISARGQAVAAMAQGGPVKTGVPYVVGDGGRPELFVPDQNGTILPRVPQTSPGTSMGMGSVTNVYLSVQAALSSPQQITQAVVEAFNRAPAGGMKIPASAVAAR